MTFIFFYPKMILDLPFPTHIMQEMGPPRAYETVCQSIINRDCRYHCGYHSH